MFFPKKAVFFLASTVFLTSCTPGFEIVSTFVKSGSEYQVEFQFSERIFFVRRDAEACIREFKVSTEGWQKTMWTLTSVNGCQTLGHLSYGTPPHGFSQVSEAEQLTAGSYIVEAIAEPAGGGMGRFQLPE